MDDGIIFPPRPSSPGHDICPDEEHPGYIPVPAILGPENYSGGVRRYTNVYMSHTRGELIQEPIDHSADAGLIPSSPHDGTKYFSERERLKTFEKWSDSYHVTPIDLARNGFIHVGPHDRVLCAFCLKTIIEWEAGDVVQKEHERLYPNCPFVRGKCQDLNVPISGAENLKQDMRVVSKGVHAKYPAFVDEAIRRETFVNWPGDDTIPSPAALASAGLFYQPLAGKTDRVKCFMCGKALHKWQANDDPWVEHAKCSKNCKFVLEQRGVPFVHQSGHTTEAEMCPLVPGDILINGPSSLSQKTPEESEKTTGVLGVPVVQPADVLNHTAAQAVLQNLGEEVSVDQVRKALEELTLANGPDRPVTSEQLLNKIWEGEGEAEFHMNDTDIMDDEEAETFPGGEGISNYEGFDQDMIVAEDQTQLDL